MQRSGFLHYSFVFFSSHLEPICELSFRFQRLHSGSLRSSWVIMSDERVDVCVHRRLSVCLWTPIINLAKVFCTPGGAGSSIRQVCLHLSARHVPEADFFIKTLEAMKRCRYVCFFRPGADLLSLLLISAPQPLWGPWTSVCCTTRRTMLCTAPLTKPR